MIDLLFRAPDKVGIVLEWIHLYGTQLPFSFLPFFLVVVTTVWKEFSINSRPLFGRGLSCRKASRKSQKLYPFVKISIAIYFFLREALNDMGNYNIVKKNYPVLQIRRGKRE